MTPYLKLFETQFNEERPEYVSGLKFFVNSLLRLEIEDKSKKLNVEQHHLLRMAYA